MKMEDHFKETLKRAVANEPPELDSWDRFQRRMHRGRSMRLFASIAAAAAVIAAGVVVVPKLMRDDRIPVLSSPTATLQSPSPSPSPDPYAGWETATNGDYLWEVRYPKAWTAPSVFEGVASIQPPGVESMEKGLPTFAVNIRFEQGATPSPMPSRTATVTSGRDTRDDGRLVYRTEEDKDGLHVVSYQIEWTACAAGETPCRPVDGTLNVRVYASTASFWNHYGEDGELIARSIRHIEPAAASPSP